jgi:hypothetical protein
LQIHAACIDYQGTGILIVGDHGSGKSTLALTALSYGMKVLTDDVCVIDTLNDRVIAFPRPIKASDHTIEIISPAVVESCPVRRVMDDTSFFFHYRSPNAYYRPASRPEYLFFLKRPSDNASVARLNETDSMSGLLRQGFNYIDKQSSFVHELLQIIRKTHRYELAFTSNWNAIDTIISTIQTPL